MQGKLVDESQVARVFLHIAPLGGKKFAAGFQVCKRVSDSGATSKGFRHETFAIGSMYLADKGGWFHTTLAACKAAIDKAGTVQLVIIKAGFPAFRNNMRKLIPQLDHYAQIRGQRLRLVHAPDWTHFTVPDIYYLASDAAKRGTTIIERFFEEVA